MRYLVLFLLFLISGRISSQILPSTFGVYKKPDGIIKNNLILHLNASETNSLDQNDLTAWNDLSSSDNDFTIKNGAVSYSGDGGGSLSGSAQGCPRITCRRSGGFQRFGRPMG